MGPLRDPLRGCIPHTLRCAAGIAGHRRSGALDFLGADAGDGASGARTRLRRKKSGDSVPSGRSTRNRLHGFCSEAKCSRAGRDAGAQPLERRRQSRLRRASASPHRELFALERSIAQASACDAGGDGMQRGSGLRQQAPQAEACTTEKAGPSHSRQSRVPLITHHSSLPSHVLDSHRFSILVALERSPSLDASRLHLKYCIVQRPRKRAGVHECLCAAQSHKFRRSEINLESRFVSMK